MKISIENFKSIERLKNFELRPFTILSGVNSSGKSSFIQLLLILKQTIERNSANQPFYLDGDLYKVKDFNDIVFKHELENSINVSFLFDKEEVLSSENLDLEGYKKNNFNILVSISFGPLNGSIQVKEFEVKFEINEDIKEPLFKLKFYGYDYSVETNDILFGNEIWNKVSSASVSFLSFYPIILKVKEGGKNNFKDIVLKLDWVKKLINSFFEQISYVGPDRVSPQEEYLPKRNLKSVTPTGDNAAQILENFAGEKIEFQQVVDHDNSIEYQIEKATLAEAVRYWMCDVFSVADDLQASKIGENYRINLVNELGLLTNIKHVGFGISQLLPIVVEGLRMPIGGTLIIEQPEIHLHPKLQSLLFDFLYGLILQRKKVIVETHSSHFITRMRRRIAEDKDSKIDDSINLTFIEDDIFRMIELDDYGTLNYYPKDFIEPSNKELRAIVKAQTEKRRKNAKP